MKASNSIVLMVPPEGFAYNTQTAVSNTFQSDLASYETREQAMNEFANMVTALTKAGIQVLTLQQNKALPDAVFPNNWFSVHTDTTGKNTLIIYPMLTENRQAEVNVTGLLNVLDAAGISMQQIIDLRNDRDEVLEGTGSLVLDRDSQIVYAALSPRTSTSLVYQVAEYLGYLPVVFTSTDSHHRPIYHTNVIMSVAKHYAILCSESIADLRQRATVLERLTASNKLIIDISLEQVNHMCGNVLELFDTNGDSVLVISAQAASYFTTDQLSTLQRFSRLVPVTIPIIETIGGGSARCMMAEIN